MITRADLLRHKLEKALANCNDPDKERAKINWTAVLMRKPRPQRARTFFDELGVPTSNGDDEELVGLTPRRRSRSVRF